MALGTTFCNNGLLQAKSQTTILLVLFNPKLENSTTHCLIAEKSLKLPIGPLPYIHVFCTKIGGKIREDKSRSRSRAVLVPFNYIL